MKINLYRLTFITMTFFTIIQCIFSRTPQINDYIKTPITAQTEIISFNPPPLNKLFTDTKDGIFIFDKQFDSKILENENYLKVVIQSQKLIKMTYLKPDTLNPDFIILAKGDKIKWLYDTTIIGSLATIKDNSLIITTDINTLLNQLNDIREKINTNVENAKKNGIKINFDEIDELLKNADKYKERTQKYIQSNNAEKTGENAEKYNHYTLEAYIRSLPSNPAQLRGIFYTLSDKNKDEIVKDINEIKDSGFNAIFIHTFYNGEAIYPGKVIQQNPKFVGIDPLQILMEECHKANLEVHFWVDNYFIGTAESSLAIKFPSWIAKNKNNELSSNFEKDRVFLCPTNDEVQAFLLNLYKEMLVKYNPDGFHIAYLRYPIATTFDQSFCFCHNCRAKFFNEYKEDSAQIDSDKNPELKQKWENFRLNQIDLFIQKVSSTLKGIKPELYLSIPIYPDADSSKLYMVQDWLTYSEKGYFDFFIPSFYSEYLPEIEKFLNKYKSITLKTSSIPAIGSYFEVSPLQLINQINILEESGFKGNIIFYYDALRKEDKNYLKFGPYKIPAAVPH